MATSFSGMSWGLWQEPPGMMNKSEAGMRYKRGTQSEAARRDGVSPSTISRKVRDGRIDLGSLHNDRISRERIETIKQNLTPPKADA